MPDPSRVIKLSVPENYVWWAVMAATSHADSSAIDTLIIETAASAGRPVPEHGLHYCAHALSSEMHLFDSRTRIVLWDGLQSFADLKKRLSTSGPPLEGQRYAVVGQTSNLRSILPNASLFFRQEPATYQQFRATLPALLERTVAPLPLRQALKHRVSLLGAKHLLLEPSAAWRRAPLVSFAGQSGRITLERAVSDAASSRLAKGALLLEQQGRPIEVSPEEGLAAFSSLNGAPADLQYRFAAAVLRIYTLSAIVARGIPHRFRFFPARNLNIYQSPLLSQDVYIDFGGINGFEQIYPRSADLLALGKRMVQVPPLEFTTGRGADPGPSAGYCSQLATSLSSSVNATVDRILEELRL